MPLRVNVLGVGISAINMEDALYVIERWIESRAQHYVCVTPVHSVMECQNNPELRKIFNRSGLTTPDGMPLVWLSRLAGFPHVSRVYGPDLMLAACKMSVGKRYRHFLYGGSEGIADTLAAILSDRFPGLEIVGACSPPFRTLSPDEEKQVIQGINAAKPDIVWVGLGAPKQERWMANMMGRLHAPVLIGVGAAFDFLSGQKKQAPRWMQSAGLEWLFRLATEPGRLWRRYLIDNPLFVCLTILQKLGLVRYDY